MNNETGNRSSSWSFNCALCLHWVVYLCLCCASMLALSTSLVLTPSVSSEVLMAEVDQIEKRGIVKLAWGRSPDSSVTGYRIFYGTNSGSYFASATIGNITNATITGLDEGTKYYAACVALNSSGIESQFSNEVIFTTGVYISLQKYIWAVSSYGLFGKTNQIKTSTNLVNWWTIFEWTGNSKLATVLHTNTSKSFFRVEVK